jgi:RimJ/RimL family protein N-acetyltransferase
MPRFEMRPFALSEAERVASWAASPIDVRHVAPENLYPLSAADLASWIVESNFAFTLRCEGDLVAYGDLIEDEVAGDMEVGHLLVAPDMRGQGMGQALLSRLCAFAAASRPHDEIWFRVGHGNAPAAACARAIGFVDDDKVSGPRFQWMRKSLLLDRQMAQVRQAGTPASQ